MKVSRRPAIGDVARLAGVSHQTVSRVLNSSGSVSPDTRERVQAAIRSLDYRPNSAARALASRRSSTIGMLAMESTLYGPATTAYAVERAARQAGFFVSVVTVPADAPGGVTADAVAAATSRLLTQGVDGIIALAPRVSAAEALAALPPDVPLVLTQGVTDARPTVAVDQAAGAEEVTQHLLERSGSTVWHVAGPEDYLESAQRVAGWRRALERHGLTAPPVLTGDWSASSGYDAGRQLARIHGVRAVFVANDHMALGLLRSFSEAGLRVPEDVLVAGFDDVPEAAFLTPPLTTMRQDFLSVGRHAVGLLLQVLDGSTGAGSVTVPAELVVRSSSSFPPQRGLR